MIEILNQVNTDPMKSQLGYLEVVEPPAILDSATSQDQVKNVGSINKTFRNISGYDIDARSGCEGGGGCGACMQGRRPSG